ncbi:hypothetical protein BDB00DRAFT_938537, partial [Zychaea mexicana]|uniref:uncharacterized protein n=1 Tax=Zychaea mexicana TaxID=64656 RepID=UPI0022FE52D5
MAFLQSSPSTPILVATSPLSPLDDSSRLKRRSKSLDNITVKRKSHLWHYNDDSTPPASPVVSFGPRPGSEDEEEEEKEEQDELLLLGQEERLRHPYCGDRHRPRRRRRRRRRRHSSSVEPTTKECLRLATIYGWVTANASHDTRINRASLSSSVSRDHKQQRAIKTIA